MKGLRVIYYYPAMNPYYFMPMNVPQGQPVQWAQPNRLLPIPIRDYGVAPFVVNMRAAVEQNNTFRTALWTGKHLQITLMSLNAGEDIGLEVHPNTDQFLFIEQGQGLVQMGPSRDNLTFVRNATMNSAIVVPAGTWHNLTNTGQIPLKLFSIYAPPSHPFGTVHETKAIAEEEEHRYGH